MADAIDAIVIVVQAGYPPPTEWMYRELFGDGRCVTLDDFRRHPLAAEFAAHGEAVPDWWRTRNVRGAIVETYGRKCYVAKAGEAIVGMLVHEEDSNTIRWFCVAQAYRRRGVGGQMLKAMIARIDGPVRLTVATGGISKPRGNPLAREALDESSRALRRFYARFGFVEEVRDDDGYIRMERPAHSHWLPGSYRVRLPLHPAYAHRIPRSAGRD